MIFSSLVLLVICETAHGVPFISSFPANPRPCYRASLLGLPNPHRSRFPPIWAFNDLQKTSGQTATRQRPLEHHDCDCDSDNDLSQPQLARWKFVISSNSNTNNGTSIGLALGYGNGSHTAKSVLRANQESCASQTTGIARRAH